MHADGAGNKVFVSLYMCWKRDRRPLRLERIAQDALIMNIDDLLCVGAVDNILLLSSTIGRNKNLIQEKSLLPLSMEQEEFTGRDTGN